MKAKTISSSAAQQVFAEMFETGKSPAAIVQEKGLAQVSDTGAIEKFCDEAIAANPGPAADFKAGKAAALNFLKGQVMKLSKGKANPALVGEILERKLKGVIPGMKSSADGRHRTKRLIEVAKLMFLRFQTQSFQK